MSKYSKYKDYNRKYSREWTKRKKLDPVWYEEWKKKQREYSKRRYAENRDKLKLGYPKLRFQVLLRDKFVCQYCGSKAPNVQLQVDHILPKSRGGQNKLNNLITACVDCNQGKGDVLLSN